MIASVEIEVLGWTMVYACWQGTEYSSDSWRLIVIFPRGEKGFGVIPNLDFQVTIVGSFLAEAPRKILKSKYGAINLAGGNALQHPRYSPWKPALRTQEITEVDSAG